MEHSEVCEVSEYFLHSEKMQRNHPRLAPVQKKDYHEDSQIYAQVLPMGVNGGLTLQQRHLVVAHRGLIQHPEVQ